MTIFGIIIFLSKKVVKLVETQKFCFHRLNHSILHHTRFIFLLLDLVNTHKGFYHLFERFSNGRLFVSPQCGTGKNIYDLFNHDSFFLSQVVISILSSPYSTTKKVLQLRYVVVNWKRQTEITVLRVWARENADRKRNNHVREVHIPQTGHNSNATNWLLFAKGLVGWNGQSR